MKDFLLIYLSVLPVILILLYVYNQDKEKEPIYLLLQLFGLGMISSFIVLSVSKGMEIIFPFMALNGNSSFLDTLLYSFIGIALVEEGCKWTILFMRGYFHSEFDELYDIIVYSVFVSLGFAFLENIVYILSCRDLNVALLRSISSIPGHACNAIFMGYYLSLAKQFHYKKDLKRESKSIRLSLIIPTILHGIYDMCLLLNSAMFIYVFLFFVIGLYIISIKKLKEVAESNKKLYEKEKDSEYFTYNTVAKEE